MKFDDDCIEQILQFFNYFIDVNICCYSLLNIWKHQIALKFSCQDKSLVLCEN